MRVCVDTAILIDILKDESRPFQEIFYAALSAKERLIVPVVVFAELLQQFNADARQASCFLEDHGIQVERLSPEAATAAGRRWIRHLAGKAKARCPGCGRAQFHKEHFLSDFYIGTFALTACDAILTRDRGIYRRYFLELKG